MMRFQMGISGSTNTVLQDLQEKWVQYIVCKLLFDAYISIGRRDAWRDLVNRPLGLEQKRRPKLSLRLAIAISHAELWHFLLPGGCHYQ